LLDLGQRCNQLFNDADIATKNKLLKFLLANNVLYNKTLSSTVIYPYTAFQDVNKKALSGLKVQNWCSSLCNLLLSKATELEQDVLYQELAETLQLNGSLLAV
jgi:hypothetical protein